MRSALPFTALDWGLLLTCFVCVAIVMHDLSYDCVNHHTTRFASVGLLCAAAFVAGILL